MVGFGYRTDATADLDTQRSRFKGVKILIIDEIFKIGSSKLLKVDTLLKEVLNDTRPFGGLHILLVGDFAQLPAIKNLTIINAMVNSTKSHVDPSDLEIQTEALFWPFIKYELRGYRRIKDCKQIKNILKKFPGF